MHTKQIEPRWIRWLEWTALIAIITLATFLRFWRIEEVPPGFNSDEAVGAMGALKTLREGLQYSYEGQGGGGALGFYFAAATFYLFGPSIAAIRGLAAWAGVMGIFANYWAIREIFRATNTRSDLNRARWIAALSTLGLATSLWHIRDSRIAFAGIGVPFLLLPSVYFLWSGLNSTAPRRWRWPFIVSGIFLGGLMYIYLSGVFVPPFYAVFFLAQWLIVIIAQKTTKRWATRLEKLWKLEPPTAYLTTQFRNLLATALAAAILLLPMIYILLTRPELEPGTTRVAQAFFLNPRINQGDPWSLLWRSFVGNFGAYGVSPGWLIGQIPPLHVSTSIGLMVFMGFLVALWRGLRGQAAYLFVLLWYPMLLMPSILSPDIIPHDLRTIGATTPTYVFAALFVVWLFETLWVLGMRWLQPHMGQNSFKWLARGVGLGLALLLLWRLWPETTTRLYNYFYIYPHLDEVKAAYHVYAVDIAKEINREDNPNVAFILPRNTAAGDVFNNYTTDFLTELEQPPASHYWVIDNEETLANDLTTAARHNIIRVVRWKTSKHTGADPKNIIPYYLEKYGHYDHTNSHGFFDIDTYVLETPGPDFHAAETLNPIAVDFGNQLQLTGFALGDAGDVSHVADPQAASNNLLWLRLAWRKTAHHSENLKASAQIYADNGQLITQMDKLLQNNILQVGSQEWEVGAEEETYFLVPIPPATPPGPYTLKLAVYGEDTLTRLPLSASDKTTDSLTLADFTVRPASPPPTPDDLTLALPTMHELLPGLTLVGFETLPGDTVRSGHQVGASLIWLAGDTPIPENLAMSLVVRPAEGNDEWSISEPVGLAGNYPSTQWQPGELLRGWLSARIPPSWEPGTYKLRLRLTPLNDPHTEVAVLPIGDFEVEGWARNFAAPQPQIEIGADFGGQATLVGLDATANQVAPGDTLGVRLYWQPAAEFDQDYTTFVHLIGPDGLLHGQVDQTPGAGAYPTTGWVPGEYIADEYVIPLPPDAPAGDYQLEIGMYNRNTGQRLPVCQANSCDQVDDKVLLPGLMVK
ncbi:MAG: hypothetical protein JXM69_21545 [Anaerolineae bacterium]|nr:hypothetical protein [Anaerolineae bacterium]